MSYHDALGYLRTGNVVDELKRAVEKVGQL
jgi:hypothetical protein